MKNFKRIAAIVLAVAFAFSVVACGGKDMSGSKYCGTWKATTAEYAGFEMSVEDLFGDFSIDLGTDGKATVTVDGDKKSGKWDEKDGKVEIDGQGLFTPDGDKLVVEMEGVTITFEKK